MPLLITAGASGWESFARRCPFSGGMVAASPYQDVEYIAVLIDRPPEVTTLAVDGDEDFVEEPRIAWPSLVAAQGSSVGAVSGGEKIGHKAAEFSLIMAEQN